MNTDLRDLLSNILDILDLFNQPHTTEAHKQNAVAAVREQLAGIPDAKTNSKAAAITDKLADKDDTNEVEKVDLKSEKKPSK